jgi:hypothetical protein
MAWAFGKYKKMCLFVELQPTLTGHFKQQENDYESNP